MSGIDAPMVVAPALERKVKGWRGEVYHMKRLVGRKSSVIICEAEDGREGLIHEQLSHATGTQ